MIELEYNLVSLGYEKAMPELKKKLNGYRRFWNRVYIGVTSDPDRRIVKHEYNNRHEPDRWSKLVCLYDAYTPEIAQDMEQKLIAYARGCNFMLDIENISSGGEGIGTTRRSNYLYVLVGGRRFVAY
jgi:hypothetical protein